MNNHPTRGFERTSNKLGNLDNKGDNYLLSIGIDAYQHCGKLANAVRDAQAFKDLLLEKYAFSQNHLITLFDEEANKKNITTAFRQLTNKLRPDDNLVVYFSGHGHYDNQYQEGYWIPVEAQYAAEVDYISYSYLQKVIKALKARHVIFIVDSCYSGAALVRTVDTSLERLYRDPSRWLLASGRNEVVPDGISGTHSPFAEQLLYVLANHSGSISMTTLANKVTSIVSYNSQQTPIGRPIYGVGDKGGEFVFKFKDSEEILSPKSQRPVQLQNPEPSLVSPTVNRINQKFIMYGLGFIGLIIIIFLAITSWPKSTQSLHTKEKQATLNSFDDSSLALPPMIRIEGGTYRMGSERKKDRANPPHSVTVKTFQIAQFEVTQKLWKQIMDANPSDHKDCDECPVERIKWGEIQDFLIKLSRRTGKDFRLPSESEWEFAARGGNLSKDYTYSGSNTPERVAWFSQYSGTHPVGQKYGNELDIYDMSGNVAEWCADVWHDSYEGAPDDGSAWTEGGYLGRHVIRGGQWNSSVEYCRVTYRRSQSTSDGGSANRTLGFRLALSE